jgi:hypothetical protein
MMTIDKKYKLLYQQKEFPVFQNRMYKAKQGAIDCPKGNIYLVQNQDTGLLVHSPEDAMGVLLKGITVLVMNTNYMREIKEMTGNRYIYVGADC